MSNSIPPLVCDTPPPIDDFDDQIDDDASGNESMEEDLSLPSSPSHRAADNSKNMDLPVPDDIHMEMPTLPIYPKSINIDDLNNTKTASDSGISNLITDKEIRDNSGSNNRFGNGTQVFPPDELSANESKIEKDFIVEKKTADVESVPIECPPNDNSYRSESPPSLVLSNDSYADDFNVESNICDSLPSLKLDSIDEDMPEFSSSSGENEISKSNDFESNEDCNVQDHDRIESHVQEIDSVNLPVQSEFDFKEPAYDVDPSLKVDSSTFALDESFDDFIEYTKTEIVTKTTSEITEIDTASTIPNSCDDENNFAADFSQFSAFSVSELPPNTSQSANFDEDTFGDFAGNVPSTMVDSKLADAQKETNVTVEDDDDFDDFGDFSDFSQSQPTISILKSATENVCANIPLLLDMMFPISPAEDIQHSVSDDITPNLDTKDMLNKTTTDLKNFDNSKALDHQWLQSIGKNSLVTALGIDSRNILYSGKWNSSMPRFAANLGFNPLEPMKSDSMLQPMSVSASSTKAPDIPAAQFDWNNSGLVNPLDASHAHTLLLDLEQLVVVANLDKIKLDSSTYSAYPSSFASTCTTSTPPTPPLPSSSPQLSITTTTTNQITSNDFHHHKNANVFSSLQHLTHNIYCNNPDDDHNDGDGYSSTFALFPPSSPSFDGSSYYNHSMVLDNANQFGMFDHYLDIRVQEILHEANASQNQSARIEPNWNPPNAEQTTNSTTTTTTAPSSVVSTSPSIAQSTVQVQLEQRRTSVDDSEEPPAPISASYVIPGSGSLKETHIYTPSKTPYSLPPQFHNSSESAECPDFDYKEAAAGIIIDENVVKKEYRDVEYNPEKFAANTTVSLASSSDDFSDFQSVPVAAAPMTQSSSFGILQPTKSSDAGIVINWPDPGNVSQLNELDNFEDFSAIPITAQSANASRSLIKEHGATSISHFDKPAIGVSPTENMFASLELQAPARSVEDEFTDFQSVEHIPSKQTISAENPILQPAAIPWSIASPNVQLPSTISPALNFVESESSKQPSLLLPQTLSSKCDISDKVASNINWPDPGINSDEMARLEAIFPVPRTTAVSNPAKSVAAPKVRGADDDEWSDFISVPSSTLAIQPITSIINQNIIKQQHDDDDWSEFVSSAPAGPNFPSWNAPPQFSSWQQQSTTLYGQSSVQQQHFVPTIYASAIGKQSTNTNGYPNPNSFNVKPMLDNSNMFLRNPKAPSISLIPDLGFAAPKAALNLTGRPAPRTNNSFTKK